MTRLLIGLLRKTAGRLYRSRALAQRVFGVAFLPLDAGRHYFDVTTPVLVRAAGRRIDGGWRVLDMGTGPFAAIGLALWRRRGCHVVATDIDPEIVRRARENIAANGAPIRVLQARFFEGVDEEFDCVTFNPPYVPSGLLGSPDPQSDGGPDGTTVIEQFLDAFADGPAASACLGVNTLLVPREKVALLVRRRPKLVLEEVSRLIPLPVDVYWIEKTGVPDGRPGVTSRPASR